MNIYPRQAEFVMPQIEVEVTPTSTPSVDSVVTVDTGLIFSKYVSATTDFEYFFRVTSGLEGGTITAASLTPSVCSVESFPVITRVGPGQGIVEVTRNGRFKQRFNVLFGESTYERFYFKNYNSGTVGKLILDEMVAACQSSKDINYYQGTIGNNTFNATRNTNCAWEGYDLSGNPLQTEMFKPTFSCANSGALITRQHLVAANHWGASGNMGPGCRFVFCGNDNAEYTATSVAITRNTAIQNFGDVMVITLDAPVPANITPFRLPGNWFVNQDSTGYRLTGTGFYVNQDKQINLCLFSQGGVTSAKNSLRPSVNFEGATYPSPQFAAWKFGAAMLENSDYSLPSKFASVNPRGGDSGGPIFVGVNGEALLVSTFTGRDGGPLYSSSAESLLNAMIAATDAKAVTAGLLDEPTGLTVEIAPDPTL
jgi:hypothetical protein